MEHMEGGIPKRAWQTVTREMFGDRNINELKEVRQTLDTMISEMDTGEYQDIIATNPGHANPTTASAGSASAGSALANSFNCTMNAEQSSSNGSEPPTEVCGIPIVCLIIDSKLIRQDADVQSNIQRLPCTKCKKTFKSKRTLGQHQAEAHVGLECLWPRNIDGVCGFNATSESDLKEHMHNVHIGQDYSVNEEEKWICPWPMCGKAFTLLEQVKRCGYKHQIKEKEAKEAKEARDIED